VALKQMKEQLRKDKEARFGKKFDAEEEDVAVAGPKKSPEERLDLAINMIRELYPTFRNPGVA
jgi:hypothetical protein